jgi:hypothetical protein
MREINREVFVADTAARIFAGMFHHPEIPPDPKTAVEMAQKLWEELVMTRGWED